MNKNTEEVLAKYPRRRSALMPILTDLQVQNANVLSSEQIAEAASQTGASLSEAMGVATFYTLYNTKPVGKYHLQVDTCVPGYLAGAEEILEHLKRKLGIGVGQTTADGLFTLSEVQDLASCGTCPVIQVNDTYYENLTIEKVDVLIDALKAGQSPSPDTSSSWGTVCNILLRNRGNPKAVDISEYQKGGGYAALGKALSRTPAEVVTEVRNAALRGRGGAGFAAGTKWGFLPKNDPRPVYLVCNADEGEPGTFKDRQILQYDPHLLVEGIAIAAQAIGAKKAFIYCRGEFRWIAEIVDRAIQQASAQGLLNHVDIGIHLGAGSYVCGEETALLESIEGKRGRPRRKPPFPANSGLYGCPTIVNNVETLACLPYILEHGAEAFKKIGVPGSYGPRIFGVSGHVNRPGTFEYPLGTTLETILEAAGGVKGTLKGVIVGGLSVAILTAAEAKGLSLDFESCLKAGTALGSGGIVVLNDTVSIPHFALRAMKFYAHESCGQCVPCWRGSFVVESLLEKLAERKGTREDIETILRLCNSIRGATLCPVGEAFTVPIQALVTKFKGEFEALTR